MKYGLKSVWRQYERLYAQYGDDFDAVAEEVALAAFVKRRFTCPKTTLSFGEAWR
jgi:hypothetical protein